MTVDRIERCSIDFYKINMKSISEIHY